MKTNYKSDISTNGKKLRKDRRVPECLIYEVMDGNPIYYHDYKSVLNKTRKIEDITGSSSLQAIIASSILRTFHKALNEENYWLMTGEPGVQLDNRNMLLGDILIYEKNRLRATDINLHYAKMPANIAIEIDTKADLSVLKFEQYFKLKTTKLHNFGVDKVLWIPTASKQVVVALPGKDWLMIEWTKDIEILPNVSVNIGAYLEKNGIELPGAEEV